MSRPKKQPKSSPHNKVLMTFLTSAFCHLGTKQKVHAPSPFNSMHQAMSSSQVCHAFFDKNFFANKQKGPSKKRNRNQKGTKPTVSNKTVSMFAHLTFTVPYLHKYSTKSHDPSFTRKPCISSFRGRARHVITTGICRDTLAALGRQH